MYTNGSFGKVKHVCDFFGRVAFELVKDDDGSLAFRQLFDGGKELVSSFAREEQLFR